jgi:hypothetical protein
MPTKNALRGAKFKSIQREVSILDIEWMARKGELLGPSPAPVDDPDFSSHLYGPSMKTVQMERVNVVYEDGEDTQVIA